MIKHNIIITDNDNTTLCIQYYGLIIGLTTLPDLQSDSHEAWDSIVESTAVPQTNKDDLRPTRLA